MWSSHLPRRRGAPSRPTTRRRSSPSRSAAVLSGSVYVLLWSNYGAKKAGAIYGTAFFGFAFLLGVFWWFGGPGIPAQPRHHPPARPGQRPLQPPLVRLRGGLERAGFFPAAPTRTRSERRRSSSARRPGRGATPVRPAFAPAVGLGRPGRRRDATSSCRSTRTTSPRSGVTRRQEFEEDAAAQRPTAPSAGRSRSTPPSGSATRWSPTTRRPGSCSRPRVPGLRDLHRRRRRAPSSRSRWRRGPTGSPSTTRAPSGSRRLWTVISLSAVPAEPVLARPARDARQAAASSEVEEPEDLAVPIAQ
jgi:hypothetical protein